VQSTLKRALDVTTAVSGIVVLSPLLAIIAAAVRIGSPGPVLHRSQRLGRYGTPFVLWKYRTMYLDSPERFNSDGSMLTEPADPRVTPVGRILRVGLDELPQLWNVVRGEMSLVGPRPDPLYAREVYRDGEERRLLVRPGITGWAQVNGRTDIPWRDRLALDLYYVDQYSLWLDLKIFALTFLELIPPLRRRRQNSLPEEVTS
jgi:lipopolysaccharide/colanic/teichoic acid biosynthesis glycosyltransferase